MALHEILIWPNPKLLEVSKPVNEINDDTRQLLNDLLETMYANDGVGLAAPQIGIHQRVLVVDIHSPDAERPSGEEPIRMINPEFLSREGELTWDEGCLSVPGESGEVTRASKVHLRYFDENGDECEIEAEGLTAVALQHEIDHLDGKLFVDYISSMKRARIRRRMKKRIQEKEKDT